LREKGWVGNLTNTEKQDIMTILIIQCTELLEPKLNMLIKFVTPQFYDTFTEKEGNTSYR